MYEIEDLFDKRSIVGAKLEMILEERKCTKNDLCKNTGVSRPTIDKLLAGTLTNKKNYEKHIEKILRYLELTPNMLLGNRINNQNKIRKIRNLCRITTDEMSQATGISLKRLKEIESGEQATIAELRDIALCLSISTNVLTNKYFFEPQISDLCTFFSLYNEKNDELSGFWGHVGILLNNLDKYLWYPITESTRSLIYRTMNNEYIVIPCMNNKVLLLCMTNVKELILLDDACDTPCNLNWDKNVSCGEIPLVIYEVLDDYEVDDQISDTLNVFFNELIKKKGWSEDDISNMINYSTIYYKDGHKRSIFIDFSAEESISLEIMQIYDYESSDFFNNIMICKEIYGSEILFNMENISMLELPLLRVENKIYELQEEF